ncbi:MAG: hypothetical protein FWH44_04295 [Methanomassiliicoccaceae archaeon]|nr:hypothetical protein [Methanomassiliicoccaceae archaeon]
MIIPVMPVRTKNGNLVSSHPVLSDASVTMTDNTVGYGDLMSSLSDVCDKEIPILIADVKGMQKGDIMPDVLRKIRSKRETWLMTGIRNAGDVMDAFHGDINKLVVPYHFTSDAALKEIIEISDCCIPAVFAGGNGARTAGKRADLRSCIRTFEKMNFRNVIVFDDRADNAAGIWSNVRDLADIIIPYVCSGTAEDMRTLHDMGFADVLVSAVRLFQNLSRRSEIGSCMLP